MVDIPMVTSRKIGNSRFPSWDNKEELQKEYSAAFLIEWDILIKGFDVFQDSVSLVLQQLHFYGGENLKSAVRSSSTTFSTPFLPG